LDPKNSFKKLFHQTPKLAFLRGPKANFDQISSFLPKSSLPNRAIVSIIVTSVTGQIKALFVYETCKLSSI